MGDEAQQDYTTTEHSHGDVQPTNIKPLRSLGVPREIENSKVYQLGYEDHVKAVETRRYRVYEEDIRAVPTATAEETVPTPVEVRSASVARAIPTEDVPPMAQSASIANIEKTMMDLATMMRDLQIRMDKIESDKNETANQNKRKYGRN